jgi:hypothetical protein
VPLQLSQPAALAEHESSGAPCTQLVEEADASDADLGLHMVELIADDPVNMEVKWQT